jgi:hypothetical protein
MQNPFLSLLQNPLANPASANNNNNNGNTDSAQNPMAAMAASPFFQTMLSSLMSNPEFMNQVSISWCAFLVQNILF